MAKRIVDLRGPRPILDIVSHGRSGPSIGLARRDAIARTVGNVPEVVVKVSGGGNTVGAVAAHLRYIGRHGRLPLELDEGNPASSMSDVRALLANWGLQIEEMDTRRRYSPRPGIKTPRLVYNLVFSMPAGTNATKVLAAVHHFAQEHWAQEHRYAMVLHTDTPRPHVHVVLKAISEQGRRLYIDRERLRAWREGFAQHLRLEGVAANATHRATRGRCGRSPRDGLYRAMRRGDSTVLRERVRTVAGQLRATGTIIDPAGPQLRRSRHQLKRQWEAERVACEKAGDGGLADGIELFVRRMPPATTEVERVKDALQRGTGVEIEPS